MRSGVVFFRMVAVIFLVSGAIGVLAPDQYIALLGADASVGGRLWGRAFGAAGLAFGAVLWMLEPRTARERRLGAVGAIVAISLTGLTDLISVVGGDLPTTGWAFVAFNAAMAGSGAYYLVFAGQDSGLSASTAERGMPAR